MEASTEVIYGNRTIRLRISPLEATCIVLQAHGFIDVDLEPMPGKVKLTAKTYKGKLTLSVSGRNLSEACENMLEKVI